ncbi:MAG: hypothetical protein IJ073_06420, partial [Lachnospiraceae bacterium]|nr:hypothetical protein [Lachnospiraceae bacterium]
MADRYDEGLLTEPFRDYNEYMEYIFDCVNSGLDRYITGMKSVYAAGDGSYKNVLYPDIEIAGDMCKGKLALFHKGSLTEEHPGEEEPSEEPEEDEEDVDDELLSLLQDFSATEPEESVEEEAVISTGPLNLRERLSYIEKRAALTEEGGTELPFYRLCKKMSFEPFTVFCFAAGILSSTQTDYAGVFQIVNENGNLASPTIESAAKVFFGPDFSITGAYGDMSTCLEQLLPVLSLSVSGSMPFSTVVSPDKRVIDCLFGRNPDKLDEDYSRFIMMLTDDKALPPILANQGVLDEMEISYGEGVRIFYY